MERQLQRVSFAASGHQLSLGLVLETPRTILRAVDWTFSSVDSAVLLVRLYTGAS